MTEQFIERKLSGKLRSKQVVLLVKKMMPVLLVKKMMPLKSRSKKSHRHKGLDSPVEVVWVGPVAVLKLRGRSRLPGCEGAKQH